MDDSTHEELLKRFISLNLDKKFLDTTSLTFEERIVLLSVQICSTCSKVPRSRFVNQTLSEIFPDGRVRIADPDLNPYYPKIMYLNNQMLKFGEDYTVDMVVTFKKNQPRPGDSLVYLDIVTREAMKQCRDCEKMRELQQAIKECEDSENTNP